MKCGKLLNDQKKKRWILVEVERRLFEFIIIISKF